MTPMPSSVYTVALRLASESPRQGSKQLPQWSRLSFAFGQLMQQELVMQGGVCSKVAALAISAAATSFVKAVQGRHVKSITFLKAKPRMAIFLPETVLNMPEMTRSTKRFFW